MPRVTAPCRLHFGLQNAGQGPGRRFGGCGVMLQQPCVTVSVAPASIWQASGPHAERALHIAQQVTTQCQQIVVEAAPPAHSGFGSGTALALAVAKAIQPKTPVVNLAQKVGRGQRSGVGLYGFQLGGFIVDAGKLDDELPLLLGRYTWPAQWCFVVLLPNIEPRWSGAVEQAAFNRPRHHATDEQISQRLAQIQLMGLLPGLLNQDFRQFSEALYDYNRTAGEVFALEQGGVYAHPAIGEAVAWLRNQGLCGVGQSSWGPAVFGLCEHPQQAAAILALHLRTVQPPVGLLCPVAQGGASFQDDGTP